jgi:tRNA threonylcarbamoyladenosine biosynthesis protein TsaB
MSEKDFTLSIETAVQGGSVALLQGVTELDGWVRTQEVSKSEDILEEIKNILVRNRLQKKKIKRVVVSRGPGSYTGVRIGMALGIGLRKALDCELVGVSALEAMLLAVKRESVEAEEEIVTAVPIGRNQICWQNFKTHNQKVINCVTQPELLTIADFINCYQNSEMQFKKIILHRRLYLDFQTKQENQLTESGNLIDAGKNIAVLNGISGTGQNDDVSNLVPIYVRESVFRKS